MSEPPAPVPADANGSFDKRKKRKAEEGEGCRTCSCKKSKCLKLYCVCFASGSPCSEACGCEPCYNKPIHGVPRNTLPVSPFKIIQTSQAGQDSVEQLIRSPMDLVIRKCTCKKSGCLKKYCDCYQSSFHNLLLHKTAKVPNHASDGTSRLQGGGWCNDVKSCVFRKSSRRGSSNHMEKQIQFTGIMSNRIDLKKILISTTGTE